MTYLYYVSKNPVSTKNILDAFRDGKKFYLLAKVSEAMPTKYLEETLRPHPAVRVIKTEAYGPTVTIRDLASGEYCLLSTCSPSMATVVHHVSRLSRPYRRRI